MKKRLCIAAISGLVVLTGCTGSQEAQSGQTPITSENFGTIAGMQWILEQMIVDGEAVELVGDQPFIQFDAEEHRVSGFASVNRFFGSVTIDETGRVQWPDPFGSTRMAGPAEQMEQEDNFLKGLQKTSRLSASGINLHAVSEDGKTRLVFFVPVE